MELEKLLTEEQKDKVNKWYENTTPYCLDSKHRPPIVYSFISDVDNGNHIKVSTEFEGHKYEIRL